MNSLNSFRLVVYITDSFNKYKTEERYEYFGDREAIWRLWFVFARNCSYKHVEVYNMQGKQQEPELGLCGMKGIGV